MFGLKPLELVILLVAVVVIYRVVKKGKHTPFEKFGLRLLGILFLITVGAFLWYEQHQPKVVISAEERAGQNKRDSYADKLNEKYKHMIGPWGRSDTRGPGFSAKRRTLLVDVNERYSTEAKVRFWAGLFANWDGSTVYDQMAVCDLGFDTVEFSAASYSLDCPHQKPTTTPRPMKKK